MNAQKEADAKDFQAFVDGAPKTKKVQFKRDREFMRWMEDVQ